MLPPYKDGTDSGCKAGKLINLELSERIISNLPEGMRKGSFEKFPYPFERS